MTWTQHQKLHWEFSAASGFGDVHHVREDSLAVTLLQIFQEWQLFSHMEPSDWLLLCQQNSQKMEQHMTWNRGKKKIHRPAAVCCWTNKGYSLLSLQHTLMGFITDQFISSSIMKKEEGYSLSICADSAYFIRVYDGVAHTHNWGRPTNPHCWQNRYSVHAGQRW